MSPAVHESCTCPFVVGPASDLRIVAVTLVGALGYVKGVTLPSELVDVFEPLVEVSVKVYPCPGVRLIQVTEAWFPLIDGDGHEPATPSLTLSVGTGPEAGRFHDNVILSPPGP